VPRHIVLLRGINLGATNRIAMPQLRELLTDAGFEDVRTYLQSGNVVLDSTATAEAVAGQIEQLIADHLALNIPVVTRTRDEIADVIRHNPLGTLADDPKRYQVTFLAGTIATETTQKLADAAVDPERFVATGRELYTWHPNGVARSKLATMMSGRGLGVTATARNWTTVTKLLELADAEP